VGALNSDSTLGSSLSLSTFFFNYFSASSNLSTERERKREIDNGGVQEMGLCVFCCASVVVRWCNAYYFRNQWWDLCSYQVYIRVHTHTHKMYMYMPFSCQKTRLALHFLCLYVCFVCPSGLRETKLSLSFFSLSLCSG
jgi:hypothetical protein